MASADNVNKRSAGKTGTKEIFCGKCEKEVKDADFALQCEICEVWFHTKCEGIPAAVYHFMIEKDAGKQLNWNFSHCHRGCAKLYSRMKQLDDKQSELSGKHQTLVHTVDEIKGCVRENIDKQTELEGRLGHMEAKTVEVTETIDINKGDTRDLAERLGALEAIMRNIEEGERNANWPKPGEKQSIGQHTEEATSNSNSDTVIAEMYERKSRENNLVIYGVPELRSDEIHDRKFVTELMQTCNVTSPTNNIQTVFRLGKPNQNRHRPMLLKLTDLGTKQDFFRGIKNLRSKQAYKGISIVNDLTKKERELEASLYRRAKNLEERGEGRHRVIGPQWRRRLVRMTEVTRATVQRTKGETQEERGRNEKVVVEAKQRE
ncbi:hypothetical protein Pcinc_000016 [Petrolisthes cinctipes]|uniref:PHD-type domain-containing protein n=1 Tax=Petrolisthes cinctipes TaxID=88211 RepID=A0AAE1L5M9_PETCI|nr:hypothetical protein Pcinc_000016 [Petrolisthes cinctipes]